VGKNRSVGCEKSTVQEGGGGEGAFYTKGGSRSLRTGKVIFKGGRCPKIAGEFKGTPQRWKISPRQSVYLVATKGGWGGGSKESQKRGVNI